MPDHPRRRPRTERGSHPSCLQPFALPAYARHTTPAARDPKGAPPRRGLTHGAGTCSIRIPRIFTTPTRSGPWRRDEARSPLPCAGGRMKTPILLTGMHRSGGSWVAEISEAAGGAVHVDDAFNPHHPRGLTPGILHL